MVPGISPTRITVHLEHDVGPFNTKEMRENNGLAYSKVIAQRLPALAAPAPGTSWHRLSQVMESSTHPSVEVRHSIGHSAQTFLALRAGTSDEALGRRQ